MSSFPSILTCMACAGLLLTTSRSLAQVAAPIQTTEPASYAELLAQAHTIPLWLEEEAQARICAELAEESYLAHLEPWQRYMVVDATFVRLHEQSNGAPGLGQALAAIIRNDKVDRYIRDYALQHYGQWCERQEAREEDQAFLWEMTADVDDTRAGTALLALQRLKNAGRLQGSVDRLSEKCADLLNDATSSAESTMVALTVLAHENPETVLPYARRLAVPPHAVEVRAVALGVLGRIGGVADRDVLAALTKQREDEGSRAANVALGAFDQRHISKRKSAYEE